MASSLKCDKSNLRKRMVQLTGLQSTCDEDFIRLYFEDDENLGESIEIKHVFLDTAQNSAVIEPKDPDAVDLIIDKQPFEMEEASVTAAIFSHLTVEIFGPPTVVCDKNEKKLNMFLKIEKRSGGGAIEEFAIIKPGKAMVKYTSEEVAERVARRQTLEFLESKLDVRLYHPKNYKPNTVIMSGLPDGTDKEYLELFFEADNKFGKSIPVDIKLDEGNNSALLTFNGIDDVLSFLEHEPLKMDGQELTIKWFSSQEEVKIPLSEIPPSCKVVVEGPTNIICPRNKSHLMLFFENKPRSGGGTIKSLEFKEDGVAHITFDDDEVASRVASKGKHVVQNQPINVHLLEERRQQLPAKRHQEREDSPPRASPISPICHKVELEGLPSNVTDKLLTVFLENEVGVEVANVTLRSDTSSAELEFNNAEDADKIVKKKQFFMKGKTIIAKPCDTCAVEVKCKDLTDDQFDYLEMYFNNEKRSGGGNVVERLASKETNTVYFKFRSSQEAERVCKRDHSKEGIAVSLYKGEFPSPDNKDKPEQQLPLNEDKSKTSCVKVGGIPESISELTLELYFENENRSGGGKIENIENDFEDCSVKYVKFKFPEAAERVSKREHTIDGYKLPVNLYVQAPFDNTKVLVKCLPEGYSKDSLFFFLEAKSNTKPKSVIYHIDQDDVVLVKMESELDFRALKKACAENEFLGVHLEISRVPFSNIIWVGNLKKNTTKGTVELYFESKKGGKGCHVEKVVNMDSLEGTCLVYFENYKDVDVVLNRKHQIENQEVLVKRYESCVRAPENGSQERTLKIPEPIEVETERSKIEFLQKNDYRNVIEEELLKIHTKVIWPADKKSAVKLECTLTKHDKGAFQLVKEWETRARETFEQCLKPLCVCEVQVLQGIWEKAIQALKSINIKNPDEVCIFTQKDQYIFKIVGKTASVDLLRQQIKSSLDAIEIELAKVKEVLVNLTQLELQLLQKIAFDAHLRSTYPDLIVRIEDKRLILEGSSCNVRDAKVDILEKSKQFACSSIDHLSRTSIELYKSTATKQYVEGKCQSSEIISVWVIEDDHVDVCCSDRTLLKQCIRILKESVKENVIDIHDIEVPDDNKKQLEGKLDEIVRTAPGKIIITVSPDFTKVIVGATNDIVDKVVKQINSCIQCNSITTKSVECEYDVLMLLQKHHMKDLEGNDDKTVKITFDKNCECIKIRCLQAKMTSAITRVNDIINKVQCEQHIITKPGIDDFMKQEKGQKHLDAIEMAYPCRLVREGREDSMRSSSLIARYECQNRHIDALVCDITEQDVGMIINPDDENLQLLGGLGRAIVSKGGDSIKHECSQHGRLADHEVFLSKGGKLKCSNIAHVKSKEWKGGNEGELRYLEDIVMNCLLQADKQSKVKSVAIPAIGCGVNNFPVDVATTGIVHAVKRFFLERQDSAIEWIYLCDTDITRVRGFSSALCKIFGSNQVQVFLEEEQLSSAGDAIKAHHVGMKRKASSKLNPKPAAILPQKSNIQMKIIKGELAQQTVDVIVNTTSRDLVLTNGAVSNSILKAAGQSLQDEVKSKYPSGLRGFKVAVSGGHKLKCKVILHTSISQCDQKNLAQGKQNLQEIVFLCLEETDKLKLSTVAFPAIGTGNLGYPHEIVAEEMWSAVAEYGNRNSQTTVRDVSFVLYPSDSKTISAFEKAQSQFTFKQSSKQGMVAPITSPSAEPRSAKFSNQPPGVFTLGTIHVNAKTGDLLQENVDCIVNGTDENFRSGMMMTNILSKCGKTLAEELDDQKDEMRRKKLSCTSASSLPCKRIIHVVVPPKSMTETIKKALELADSLRIISSVGIPAIDVERNKNNVPKLAKQMVQGVKQFAKSNPSNIQEVRFVLFNAEYLGMFQSAIEEASEPKANETKSYLDWVPFFGGKKSKPSAQTETLTKPVTFNIYSLSSRVIEDVKKKINACLDEEMKTIDFDDEVIESLDDHQVSELQAMMRQCHVSAEIDQLNSLITITGIKDNVHEASFKIQTFLRDVSDMDWVGKLVQWYAILVNDDGEEISEYDKGVNALLERAYTRKERTVTYLNRNDNRTYVIDFDKMEETPENDTTCAPARVLRRDRVRCGLGCELPFNWDDMTGKIRVVKLNPQSKEFGDIAANFTQSAGKYTTCTVEQIERIQNKHLWEQYQSKKKEMDDVNVGQINERRLWHGTSDVAVDSINMYGFNRSYCGKNATKFGEGVYFAVNAEYSCMQTYSPPDAKEVRRMYYCRVLTGDYALGEEGMRVPPANPRRGRHCIYNSVVNDLNNPIMYVIFHDSQAYPEYLIYFKR